MVYCLCCGAKNPDKIESCKRCGAPTGKPAKSSAGKSKRAEADDHKDPLLGYVFESLYRVDQFLGSGGLGQVYRGTNLRVDQSVAIKVLSPNLASDDAFLGRFELETKNQAKLQHHNIVRVHDFVRGAGSAALVMELVQGATLGELIKNQTSPIRQEPCTEILLPVLEAMEYAHDRGVVHRDLKPSNIMLYMVGEKRIPKVMDFGLARALTEGGKKPASAVRIGPPWYMSPELCGSGREIDARADLYSLGVIFFEMASGRVPFDSDNDFQVMSAHMESPVPRLGDIYPDVEPGIQAVVEKAMAKDSARRFQSATEFAQALKGLSAPPPDISVPAHSPPAVPPPQVSAPEADTPDEVGEPGWLSAPVGHQGQTKAIPDEPSVQRHAEQSEPIALFDLSDQHPAGSGGLFRPGSRGRKFMLGVTGFLLIGIGMGLFTDFGFFGLHYLTGGFEKEREAKKTMAQLQKEMGKDTYASYLKSLKGLEAVAKVLSENPDPMALQVQAVSAMLLRFGANKARKAKATEMLTGLRQADANSKEVDKATALVMAFLNKQDKALASINKSIAKNSKDAVSRVYEGWIYQQDKKYKEAAKSYAAAIKADSKLPAALYGEARVLELQAKFDEAFKAAERCLKVNPRHTGGMLLKARLLVKKKKAEQGKLLLEGVIKQGKLAAPIEKAEAFVTLGELNLATGSLNAARENYQKALKLNPNAAEALLGLGNLQYQAKKYDGALKQFQAARKLEPNNVDASFMIARTMLALGKPMDALKALMAIGPGAKERAELPFLLGRVEEELGEFKDAEKHFREAMKKQPKFFKGYLHLSRIYMKQKDPKKALGVLAEAQQKMPTSGLVLNAQGEVYLAGKHWKKALAKFQRALFKDPNLNLAIFNMANCLFELGSLKKARDKYMELQKRDDQFPGLAAKMADLFSRLGAHPDAAKQWEIALTQEPPNVDRRIKAARSFVMAGTYKRALDETELALRKDASLAEARAIRAEALLALAKSKDDAKLGDALVEINNALGRQQLSPYYVILGEIHLKRGKELEAIDAFSSALKLDGSLVDIQTKRAILLIKNGTVKDGLLQLKKTVSHYPTRGDIHLYMGKALYDLGEEAKALAAFRTATAREPNLGEAHYRIAMILYDRRGFSAAAPLLKRAVSTGKKGEDPWLEDAYLHLGFTYERLNNRAGTIEAFKKYMEVSKPTSAMRHEVEKRLRAMGVIKDEEF